MQTPNDTGAWGSDADKTGSTSNSSTQGTVEGGLARLFGMQSMVSDNRSLQIVGETKEELDKFYKSARTSTTNEVQRETIPTVEALTGAISPQLPGLGFYTKVGGTLYVYAILFSDRTLNISSERLSVNTGGNNLAGWGGTIQQISVPLTPVQYINKNLIEALTKHYTAVAERDNIKNVEIIGTEVYDLEMLNHPEAGDLKDRPRIAAVYLANEWEEAILVRIPQEIAAAKRPLPVPFIEPEKPYGADNCAEARVTAVEKRMTRARTLTAANMEVTVATSSKNNSNYSNSREICRTLATVSLAAVPYEDHNRMMMQQQAAGNMSAIQQFLSMAQGSQSGYINGYRPLRPTISIEAAQAGEMMGNNGGLYPLFYGLFSLMVTNTNYVFMEALRRKSVGSRGNLSALELRIEQMLRTVPGNGANRMILDDKKVLDTDFLNGWIRQNVSPQATFQINLVPHGPHAAQIHFLGRLASNVNTKEVQTVVGIIDAMTKNKFSELVNENIKVGKGWNPTKPILIPTGTLVANGLAEHAGQKLNTQELDEMAISHYKAKAPQAVEALLSIQYGTNSQNEDPKHRAQRFRTELSQSVYEHGVHINAFSQTCVWAPDFMAVFGQAMDTIGEMSAANNMGSFRNNLQAFAPGMSLATYAHAGVNNNLGSMGFFI